MTLDIRVFEITDYPAAMALWQATPGVGLSGADSLQGVAQYLERNPGMSFVAMQGQTMIGTILCGHDGRRGLIHHLVVGTSHRRLGLGEQLVRRSLAVLRAQGIDKCHLLVFRDNREGAAFWRRIGAVERTELFTFSLDTPRQ